MTSWPGAALIEIKRGTFGGKKLDGAIAAKRLYEYIVLNGDCAGEWLKERDTETTVEEWEPLVPVREGLLLNLHKALLGPCGVVDLEQAAEELLDSVSEELGLIFGKHAVFWGKFTEAEYLKTAYHKLLMREDFYPLVTIRNGNTFDKIATLFTKG